ncbi:hypothetical protein EI983_17840 [Roseovarius faecimaris]|uniref:Glycosyltransferase family 2 protein n=1 Tax=Roseovarius faecimaris TaxID=2494550 RepID=A0A6I6J5J1_9RHOB|nr:hypothetical protein [Roseovarius faecimaris]QGY00029.1 hypothetical protein EI983_17840 [Roseovarius faecimaris]
MERFAAVTMVYQDYWFLKLWLDYYSKQFGRENLYVLGHGYDEQHEEMCAGANLIRVPRNGMFPDFDAQRWRMLSDYTAMLKRHYSAVICTDVDEIIVAHRKPGELANVISDHGLPGRAGAIGFEVLGGDEFDETRPVLQQTQGCVFSSRYSKPCVIRTPGQFTPGAHGMNEDWQHSDELVLFHLQYANGTLRTLRKQALRDDIREAARTADRHRADHRVAGLKDWVRGKEVAYRRTLGILEDGEHLPFEQAVARCHDVLEKTMFRTEDGPVRVRPRQARFFRTSTHVPEHLATVF